jgi:hypothetical protein
MSCIMVPHRGQTGARSSLVVLRTVDMAMRPISTAALRGIANGNAPQKVMFLT